MTDEPQEQPRQAQIAALQKSIAELVATMDESMTRLRARPTREWEPTNSPNFHVVAAADILVKAAQEAVHNRGGRVRASWQTDKVRVDVGFHEGAGYIASFYRRDAPNDLSIGM